MKFLKVIYISIGVFFIIILVGCNSVQKGSKKPFRLKEPRLAPLTESQWNEEQIKLLTPYKREDGSVLNVVATLGRHPKLFDRFMPFGLYVLPENKLCQIVTGRSLFYVLAGSVRLSMNLDGIRLRGKGWD